MIKKATILFGILALITTFVFAYISNGQVRSVKRFTSFDFNNVSSVEIPNDLNTAPIDNLNSNVVGSNIVVHIPKPKHVKGVYMSSWVAGTDSFRNKLTNLAKETEINSIVIDFKDSEGVVSLPAKDGASQDRINASSKRAPNLGAYLDELHKENIYTIARIAVFEDPIYAKNNPSQAVQNSLGNLWKDKHGLAWVDASSLEFREYILEISLEAYELGFDEINFDYIRFPTDGPKDKIYPISGPKPKAEVINSFLSYVYTELNARGIPVSIDVFGQIVSTQDDMGIGQQYDELLKYTDAIAPMVYPSHFYPGYKNIKSPESSPYETIKYSLTDAINRRAKTGLDTEIRPWLQDFGLAVPYDAAMVRAQINAAKDLGINSFLLWDPKNRYTKAALELESAN